MSKKIITREDLTSASEKYKNWGKWGDDDEIGTLNYTSPEDIIKTIDHEVFHYCVDKLDIKIDDEQEHKVIYYLQWADEYLG